MRIDHIIWAVPDLELGVSYFEELTGICPAPGGSHPGHGTRNAIASLGDDCYVEVIGPDPRQRQDALLPNNLLSSIAQKRRASLYTFVVQTSDLSHVAAAAARADLTFEGPVVYSRDQPAGPRLRWSMGFTGRTSFGLCLPFYINWQDAPHPSKAAPQGLRLVEWEVLHPDAQRLRRLYEQLEIDARVRCADQPGFRALLLGPMGEVALTSEG